MANGLGTQKLFFIEVTKNLQLITGEKRDVKVVDLKLTPPQKRPLLILLEWFLAKPQYVNKFASFYVDHGFDILTVHIKFLQFVWPWEGSQEVASHVIKFLDVNRSYAPLVLHGFSVGSYVWGEVLVQIENQKARYHHIINRIVGQVWDSAADITIIPYAFASVLFPTNRVLQYAFEIAIMCLFKGFKEEATSQYLKSCDTFRNNLVHAPALMFLSKTDPIGTEKWQIQLRDNWVSMGIVVQWKCWEESPHVGHYLTHREEYMEELIAFLSSLGLLASTERNKAKL